MSGTAIIPVIHYADHDQALRNAERAFEAGCQGVMLIEMRGRDHLPVPAALTIKQLWPDRLVGLNFLNATEARNMPVVTVDDIDMTWTDQQLTHTMQLNDLEPHRVKASMSVRPGHLFFCAVAFKYQRPEPQPGLAARHAVSFGFIPTTSGPATGQAADPRAVAVLRDAIGPDAPLAIASGITPDNAADFLPLVTHALVSTGVSSSFHEFDPSRLSALTSVAAALRARAAHRPETRS